MSQRTVVIGDIHGCYRELLDLLEACAVADGDRVVSVGDLVDRGPSSLEVCDWFLGREGAVVLMGNHERKHVRGVRSYAQDIVALQLGDRYAEIRSWMRGLPYSYEDDSAIVVHAAFEHDVALADQREDVLAGTTSGERYLAGKYADGYWPERYTGDKPIIFGHHVVGDEARVWNDRVFGIDTGACHGGRLSAVILPELRVVSVASRGDHWAEQKRAWQASVLAARPWAEMSYEQIAGHLERAKLRGGPGVAEVVAGVRGWLEEIERAKDAIVEAIDRIATELGRGGEAAFTEAARRHPASGWLFRHRRDPVGRAEIDAGCRSPAAVVDLAGRLDIKVRASVADSKVGNSPGPPVGW
jgi:serine/threonine protein phosphatase 1